MDYDRGAPDLGLASTLDEILGEADPLGAWDADLRSQAPQKTPGDAPLEEAVLDVLLRVVVAVLAFLLRIPA